MTARMVAEGSAQNIADVRTLLNKSKIVVCHTVINVPNPELGNVAIVV